MRFLLLHHPWLHACLVAGFVAAAAPAHADGVSPLDATAQQKTAATQHFVAGKRAMAGGDSASAIAELSASLAIVDSPNTHIELARALRDSARFDAAWVEYGRAAATATMLAPREARYAQTAKAARAERVEVEVKLAFVTVTVSHAPEGAALRVGRLAVPTAYWSSPAPAPPGQVEVELTAADGHTLARRTVTALAGSVVPVALDAQPPMASAGSHAAPAPDDDDSSSDDDDDGSEAEAKPTPKPSPAHVIRLPSLPVEPVLTKSGHAGTFRGLALASFGVGAAGLATFIVSGLVSQGMYNDLESSCPHGCPPSRQGEIDAGVATQTVANVGLVVGIVGAVAGGGFLLGSALSAPSDPTTSLLVGPGYIGVRGAL